MDYRVATLDDAQQLADFAARMFTVSYQHLMDRDELTTYVTSELTAEAKNAELSNPRFKTFLACADAIVGYSQIAVDNLPDCPIDARKPAELRRLYVDPAWHGRGVAQELLALVEAEARDRQCDMLWLAVWEINDRAISFYNKNDFRVIGRQGFPIGNEIQSDFVMARPVANELR